MPLLPKTARKGDEDSDSDTLTLGYEKLQSPRCPENETVQELANADPPFLAEIESESKRIEVRLILDFDQPVEERLKRISNLVTHAVYLKCEEYMKDKEWNCDFVPLLPVFSQELAKRYEKDRDVEGLKQLVNKHGSNEAKESFQRWRERYKLTEEDIALMKDEQQLEESTSQLRIQRHELEDGRKSTHRRERERRREVGEGEHRRHGTNEETGRLPEQHGTNRIERRRREDHPREEHPRPRKDYQDLSKMHSRSNLTENSQSRAATEDRYELEPHIDIFDDEMPDEMNIVLLGGSGNGKSTYVNALANQLMHHNLKSSRQDPAVLIKTSFTHFGPDNTEKLIEMKPTIATELEEGETEENEDTRPGMSSTQRPKSYVFTWGRKTVRIIDNPGINDVRGVEIDKLNFTKIISFISSFEKIHAFLFVVKANEDRLDLGFRHGMNELLRHLHSSAAKNIIFCVTNSKGHNYKPGQTYPTLKTYLDEINEERKIRIQLEGRVFVYDSIYFRYICEQHFNVNHSPKEKREYKECWHHNRHIFADMFKTISRFTPHDVKNTLSVNRVRRAIELLARPLAVISKNLLGNIQIIENKRREIENRLANGENLQGRLFIEQIHMDTVDLEHPVTVCTHADCVEWKELQPNGAKEIVYSQECHKECHLLNLIPGEIPNENLRGCEIFSDIGDENHCSVCGHGYQLHMHLKYRLVRRVDMMINRETEMELAENDDQIEIAERFVAEREQQRMAYQKELDKKQEYCAHFANFLQEHAVLHYNDQYLAYLNQMIREEEDGIRFGGDDSTLPRLIEARDQYNELVKVFQQTKALDGVKTLQEIEGMIEELKTMDDGEIMRDVENLEFFSLPAKSRQAPVIKVNQRSTMDKVWDNSLGIIFGKSNNKKKEKRTMNTGLGIQGPGPSSQARSSRNT